MGKGFLTNHQVPLFTKVTIWGTTLQIFTGQFDDGSYAKLNWKICCCIQSCAYLFGQPLFQDSEETIHRAEKK